MEAMTHNILGCQLITVHTDVSTKSGERVIVLILDTNLESRF